MNDEGKYERCRARIFPELSSSSRGIGGMHAKVDLLSRIAKINRPRLRKAMEAA